KALLLILLAAVLLPMMAQEPTDGIQQPSDVLKIQYDKPHNTTVVTIPDSNAVNIKGAKAVVVHPFYTYNGKVPASLIDALLSLYVVDGGQEGQSARPVELEIDGNHEGPYSTVRLGPLQTECGTATVYSICGPQAKVIQRLAVAQKVVGRIGKVEVEVSPETVLHIKLLSKGIPKPDDLESSYDRKGNSTIVDIKSAYAIGVAGAKSLIFDATYTFRGKTQSSAVDPAIGIRIEGGEWISESDFLSLTIDGTKSTYSLSDRNSNTNSSGDQIFIFTIREENASAIIEKIAKSKIVTGSISDIRFELSPGAISEIKTLYERMHKK